jgi:dihydroorotate dehydrogenase electron transfer subunit
MRRRGVRDQTGEPPGSPVPPPLVRFADRPLRGRAKPGFALRPFRLLQRWGQVRVRRRGSADTFEQSFESATRDGGNSGSAVELPWRPALRRERRRVAGTDAVGPYTLLRIERGDLDAGTPGQFFMLEAPGRLLPRPMSLCLAPADELGFLIDPIGPGTRALCDLQRGEHIDVYGPLGNGFRLDVDRPLLVGGGIGVAPLPYLSHTLGGPPALLGFRSALHAEAAALVPNAQVVIEPTYVTALLAADGSDVLACGPEPMLEAVREIVPAAQLAWEAPMACGYGACYGCAVEIEGTWRRLCVDGPVLQTGEPMVPREAAA